MEEACQDYQGTGGFTSIVHNDLVTHEAELINLIKARGIKEIVTTG